MLTMLRRNKVRIKEGFILREIAGHWVLVPTGDSAEYENRIITLTSSAALLWKALDKGVETIAQLADALLNEYEIDHRTALRDAEEFVAQLVEEGMLE